MRGYKEKNMSRVHESLITHRIAAFICGLCLLLVLLITATQAVCYWIPDWWRNEYAKYDTPANVNGEMSLDDAVKVTEDMLEYCIGRLDTLDGSTATIDGVTQPFFTDREKSHLSDCRNLFRAAIKVRVMAALFIIAFAVYIYMHNGKQGAKRLLASGYLKALGFIVILAVIILLFALHDFTYVFTVFHHIFFDNDLWILDPRKDNLINIMQEDVFSDAAIWIAGIWLAVASAIAIASAFILKNNKKEIAEA